MKVLITYFSATGKTAEIARAMADHAQALGHAVDVKSVTDVITTADFDGYDVVAIGSACHSSSLAQPVLALLNDIPSSPGYALAGFVTHSTVMADHPIYGELYERWAGQCLPVFERVCEEKAIPFKGYFHCQGRPSEGIAQFIHNTIIIDDGEWAEYFDDVQTHPDAQDIADAKTFIEGVLP